MAWQRRQLNTAIVSCTLVQAAMRCMLAALTQQCARPCLALLKLCIAVPSTIVDMLQQCGMLLMLLTVQLSLFTVTITGRSTVLQTPLTECRLADGT